MKCPWHRVEKKLLRSKEMTQDRGRHIKPINDHYCSHRHSPKPRKSIGALSCGGDLEACPLTKEQLRDDRKFEWNKNSAN